MSLNSLQLLPDFRKESGIDERTLPLHLLTADHQPSRAVMVTSALENLPHLAKRVSTLWGDSEFETYVNRLIMDSRDGARQGLPWEAAQDLLFLVELSVAKRALTASEVTGVPFQELYARCLAAVGQAATPSLSLAAPWSDPRASHDASRVERDRPSAQRKASSAKPAEKSGSAWKLFG